MLELECLFISHIHIYIYMCTQLHTINGLRVPETWDWRYMQINSYMYDWLNYNCIEGSWFKLWFSAILSSHENAAEWSTTWPLPYLVMMAMWGQRFWTFTERRYNHTFLKCIKTALFLLLKWYVSWYHYNKKGA